MKKRILVIDDDNMVVWIIEQALKREGYEVHSAKNGAAGLEKARVLRPDLIILDVMMPQMDGYEVCWRLKSDRKTAAIDVLMLTARGGLDENGEENGRVAATNLRDRQLGFEVGATDFISKPVPIKELLTRVNHLMQVE